jgi:hypothetical protein
VQQPVFGLLVLSFSSIKRVSGALSQRLIAEAAVLPGALRDPVCSQGKRVNLPDEKVNSIQWDYRQKT